MSRYRRAPYSRMADYATLITGPSGTGKELVARAIGLSRYLPFDARRGEFADDFFGAFFPLNLSALSPPSSNPSCSGTAAARSPARWPTAPAGWKSARRPARSFSSYTRLVHAQSGGNVEETARRLDQDRRTVKARLA